MNMKRPSNKKSRFHGELKPFPGSTMSTQPRQHRDEQSVTRLDAHEMVCEERHETINNRIGKVEVSVEPIPVMASTLRIIARLMWFIALGVFAACGTLVWTMAVRHAAGS